MYHVTVFPFGQRLGDVVRQQVESVQGAVSVLVGQDGQVAEVVVPVAVGVVAGMGCASCTTVASWLAAS